MKRFLETYLSNLFLWAPFWMILGSGIYFAFPSEPVIAYPLIISILCAACAFRFPKNFLFLIAFGFFWANAFTNFIDTPKIKYDMRNTEVTGVVKNIDYADDRARIFIKSNIGLLRVSTDLPAPNIGDEITATVSVFPPNGPYAPGGFDYARWSYFNGLTATGYLTEFNVTNFGDNNSIREYIHSKTNSFLSDTLVLGYKYAVPKGDNEIWKSTGINHVWSISGFHMTLVGGWLFLMFYALFRLIAPITKRMPARYPALAISWIGLLGYLFLSGVDVATLRAFLMTTLIYLAVLVGRHAFSMRNITIAMIIIYLSNPHFALQPGFQLSFAAMYGLIWYFSDREYKKKNIWTITKIAAMTSIIATMFTSALVAYHFNFLPLYGLIGNLILLPIFSFIIMPLVMVGTITALFGWTLPLVWCADIYQWTLSCAKIISELPGAVVQIPNISGLALSIIIVGFLILMFAKSWRGFFAAIAIGVAIIAFTPSPIFYSTYDNELVGYVNNGKLEFNKAKSSNHYFAFETWKLMNYESPDTPNPIGKCENSVCRFGNIVHAQKYVPLARNIVKLCRDKNIDFIVSYFRVNAPNCNAKILKGGFVIYPNGRVKYLQLNRKWH